MLSVGILTNEFLLHKEKSWLMKKCGRCPKV
jgi:hypothetical protein